MGSVYRVIEVIGTSEKSWEDAAATAVATAIGSDGKVESYRTRLDLSFKYEAS